MQKTSTAKSAAFFQKFLKTVRARRVKNPVTAVVSLYMVNLENLENQNSEVAVNTIKVDFLMKLPILICILKTALP